MRSAVLQQSVNAEAVFRTNSPDPDNEWYVIVNVINDHLLCLIGPQSLCLHLTAELENEQILQHSEFINCEFI